MQTLREALQDTSVPVDPNLFTVSRPAPKEGAANNGEQISGLFIWLLGHLAKAVVKQCIDEVAISHKNADPIGVVVATVMSNPEFHWRGESLIDIIMSKFRVTAPALFGIRGNDKTEAGRTKLGWRRDKDTGAWADSAEENVRRMTGLGRGYAAISLRDFSRSRSTNPWPPSRYWTTIACITSAPPGEASSTHYAVLKGMISQFEERFLAFYGTAGIAALKVALVDFPRRAEKGNVGAQALTAVADGLRKDYGLVLDPKLYKW
jgi:nucleoporin GLE1